MIKYWIAAVTLGVLGSFAQAQTYGFDCISNNNAGNCAAGESQMRVAVSSYSPSQALFIFTNTGSAASSLTDVYFDVDNASLLNIAFIPSSAGVAFSVGATPSNLPAGNTVGFDTTLGISADSNNPPPINGVNPGETLSILTNLQAGRSFADVSSGIAAGTLRIGIHVQAFGNGGSESFVGLATPVPEAPVLAYLLGGLGLIGWRFAGRRHGTQAA